MMMLFLLAMAMAAQVAAPEPPGGAGAPPAVTVGALTASSTETIDILQIVEQNHSLSWLAMPLKGDPAPLSDDDMRTVTGVRGLAAYARRTGLAGRPETLEALRAVEAVVLAEFAKRELIESIVVTDADVAADIAAHPGLYDEYQLKHIFVSVGPAGDGSVRTDADARARADELRQRLRQGEGFEALAATASDDASTRPDGGALSTIRGVYLLDVFRPVALTLPEGGISDPIRSEQGYHILKLEHRTPATPDMVRPVVVDELRKRRLPAVVAAAIGSGSGADASDRARP